MRGSLFRGMGNSFSLLDTALGNDMIACRRWAEFSHSVERMCQSKLSVSTLHIAKRVIHPQPCNVFHWGWGHNPTTLELDMAMRPAVGSGTFVALNEQRLETCQGNWVCTLTTTLRFSRDH